MTWDRRRAASQDRAAASAAAEQACWPSLCRLLFQVGRPLALACERIHARAMCECPLARGDVLGLARPCLLRCRLQCATVGEGEPPGQGSQPVHGIEMGGSLLISLAA